MDGLRDDWTLPEANAALPTVRALLAEGRAAVAALRDVEAQLQDLRIVWGDALLDAACPGHGEFTSYAQRSGALRHDLETVELRFHALGCEPKDLEQGLVDFRGRVAGQEAYLCWRDGEETLSWWHPLEGGFAARRPIPGAKAPVRPS
ncbi:MAG TPA: DUF2203 domain-containing protein [Candidatus Thermoplasmatota archaeon]|nr:DUF2203 domain-containing protein [Candidatus Thermoplasmatota archaeon]